jgi:hypothetical protein
MGGAILHDPAPSGVGADEAGGLKREGGTHFGQVFKDVVGAAAVGAALPEDAGEHFLAGVVVNDFDVIHDEVAGGEKTSAGRHEKSGRVNDRV